MNNLINSRVLVTAAMLSSTLLLSACVSSPNQHFYTLAPVSEWPNTRTDATTQAGVSAYRVVVGPVSLPDAVDRPQLVIRRSLQTIDIKEERRWAGGLSAEIAQAITTDLSQALPSAMVFSQVNSTAAQASANYRISLDVQRFDSLLDTLSDLAPNAPLASNLSRGSWVSINWTLTDLQQGNRWVCQSRVQTAATASGYEALIVAHKTSLSKVALAMASLLKAVVAGREPALPIADSQCLKQHLLLP